MALFGTLNVMGPAHRGAQLQSLAQTAAQNVMRRQRMKALLRTGAAAAAQAGAGHAAGGPGMRIRGSAMHSMVGTRGHIQRPNLTADQLAQMARSAANQGHLPDGRLGGVYGPGGGGFDFGSIPDSSDHSQSPASLEATAAVQGGGEPPKGTPALNPSYVSDGQGGYTYVGPDPSTLQPGQAYPNPDGSGTSYAPIPGMDAPAPSGNVGTNLIPLGNGMYYDPVADAIRGIGHSDSQGLSSIDRKF